jgi:hypothetical protein
LEKARYSVAWFTGVARNDGFGLQGVLADPQLEVFSSDGTRLAVNDN